MNDGVRWCCHKLHSSRPLIDGMGAACWRGGNRGPAGGADEWNFQRLLYPIVCRDVVSVWHILEFSCSEQVNSGCEASMSEDASRAILKGGLWFRSPSEQTGLCSWGWLLKGKFKPELTEEEGRKFFRPFDRGKTMLYHSWCRRLAESRFYL